MEGGQRAGDIAGAICIRLPRRLHARQSRSLFATTRISFGGPSDEELRAALAIRLHKDDAAAVNNFARLAGWHVYDGHIKGDREARQRQVSSIAEKVSDLQTSLRASGVESDVVAGGSYTFNLWPRELTRYVSPGSWTYSSSQHDVELADLGWEPAAFVLTTVISVHAGTATLDAGSKAISPDKPMSERFRWHGKIISMSEEHTVVEADDLKVGDRLFLMPQHTCTTAYLYDNALVKTFAGPWERRQQLGSKR